MLLDSEGFGFSTTPADYINYGVFLGRTPAAIGTNGPLGDNYMTVSSGSSFAGVIRVLPTAATTFFAGVRLNYGITTNSPLIVFSDPSGAVQLTVAFTYSSNGVGAGQIVVYRGAKAAVLGQTALGVVPLVGWSFIEVGATIGSSGAVTIRVNGAVVLALSGVNTQASGTASVQQVMFASDYSGVTTGAQVSHYYLCDNTGPGPWNTFLGDVRVQTLRVTSNDAVQFTPSPATIPLATGTASTTTSNTAAANTVYYQKLTQGSIGGVLTQAAATLTTAFTGNAHMALYADNGAGTGPSGAPLATSAAVTNPAAGTVAFAFSGGPRLAAGTICWLALQTDTASSWRQNTSNPGSSQCSQAQPYSSGFPVAAPGAIGADLFYMNLVAAPTNADIVSQVPPVPGTVFNADANVGDQDTFNCTPVATGLGNTYGVNVKVLGLKSDAGARSLQIVLKSGATTVAGTPTALAVTAQQLRSVYQTNPATGAAWTQAAVNAIKPGYKISA